MKLVVGIDFSKNARAAGITAAALAGRWNETLAVAHVVDDSVSHRLPGDVRETLAASTSDRLHSEAVHLGSEGVNVEEHMLSGAPEQALADLAIRSGRTAADRLIGRPSSQRVLNSSRIFGEQVGTRLAIDPSPYEEREFEDGEHKARPLISVRQECFRCSVPLRR